MAGGGCIAVACMMACLSAYLLAPELFGAFEGQWLQFSARARLGCGERSRKRAGASGSAPGMFAELARTAVRGVPGSRSAAVRWLAAHRPWCLASDKVAEGLVHCGVPCRKEAVWLCLLALSMGVGVSLALLLESWPVGLALGLCAPAGVRVWVGRRAERRASDLREQVPDALRTIDAAVCAGLGLPRALDYAARSTAVPLGPELSQVVWDVQTGQGLEEALERLKDRASVPELSFVVVAMEVQHRSGGSLHRIFEVASEAVAQSFDLERSLQVKTAQARLSARVVGVMPLLLLLLLALISPGYFQSFTGSALGVSMLLVAAVLDGIGLLVIRSIMEVEL